MSNERQLRPGWPGFVCAIAWAISGLSACGGLDVVDDPDGVLPPDPGTEDEDVHDEPADEPSVLFAGTTTVKDVISSSCTTASVRGLSVQIADEMVCMRPNAFAKFTEGGGIDFSSSAVLPYMAPPAADALKRVAASHPLSVNSGFRTIAQQYLLYRWSVLGRCGIAVAAKPGRSNHETGRAVDLANWSSVVTAMGNRGWSHSVPGDPVHFDYLAAADLRGLDVLAFQRLWNRNHPGDPIAADGVWGPQTATALGNSPSGGFATGATCNTAPPPPDDPPNPPSDGATIIVDSKPANNDPTRAKVEVSANWMTTMNSAAQGGSYLWASTQAVSDGATFWFYLAAPATRTIDARWTAGGNRAPAAPFMVFDSAGTKLATVTRDQRSGGGAWNTLGSYSLRAGWNRVVLSRWTTDGSVVIADAIAVR